MRRMQQCVWELRYKMIHQQNKWATFNIVMTLHLTLWSRELYLLNIIFPADILTLIEHHISSWHSDMSSLCTLSVLFCTLPFSWEDWRNFAFIHHKTRKLKSVFALRKDLKICVCTHMPHAQLNRTTHLLLLNDVDWIQLTQDMFHMLAFGEHCRWSKNAFSWDMTSDSFRGFCCLLVHDGRQYKVSLKFWYLSPSTQCDLSNVQL
jgi:hypothetical protein